MIDVRSPSEFGEGHIPGAHNLPVFSDDERAEIGTLYKQTGRQEAIEKGLEFIGPRMLPIVQEATRIAPDRKVSLYCWRGGMRSGSVQWLLELCGFEVQRINGGYKAYRQEVHEIIEEFCSNANWQVIGGLTGAGKTDILKELQNRGEQIIDLEGLASHRGSAFGYFLMDEQPSTSHFMNLLAAELVKFDPDRRIWIEDESRRIGRVALPDALYNAITHAPVIVIEKSAEERAKNLSEEYGRAEYADFEKAFGSIVKRIGGPAVREALEAVKNGQPDKAAVIALRYYDKTYRFGLARRKEDNQQYQEYFFAAGMTPEEIAAQLINDK